MATDLQKHIQELLTECLADFQLERTESQGTTAHTFATQIPRLDKELTCLQNARRAISADISLRVARISTRRNSLLPIHQLSPELLSNVLEASLDHFDTTPDPRTTKRLLAFATVSRHWKDVLDQSPAVWGWIDTFRDAPFAVKKSQHAPLSINLVNEGELQVSQLQEGFDTLFPHSNRWRSLQLHLTATSARYFAQVFRSLSMPSLQDLGFTVNARLVDEHPSLENLERYPLRRLVLSGISTSWDTVASFTELRSLKIANLCYGNSWPSRDQITTILLRCIHLEELALSNLENHPAEITTPPLPQSTFYLPALRSIEFNDILNAREAAVWLLDCISAPNLRGLSVTGARLNTSIGQPIASFLKRQRSDSPFPVVMAFLRPRPVQVHMSQRMCRFDCAHVLKRGVHQGLELHLPGGGFADTYQRVADILPGVMGDPPHPPLDVHLETLPQRYHDPDPAFLCHLPTLFVLRMKRVPNVEAFLQFLCSREPGDSGEYYCPNLTEIHILGGDAALTPLTLTETQCDAAKQLLEIRPNISLYDREGRHFSLYSNGDGNQ